MPNPVENKRIICVSQNNFPALLPIISNTHSSDWFKCLPFSKHFLSRSHNLVSLGQESGQKRILFGTVLKNIWIWMGFGGRENILSNYPSPYPSPCHASTKPNGPWRNRSKLQIPLRNCFSSSFSFSFHLHTSMLCSCFNQLKCPPCFEDFPSLQIRNYCSCVFLWHSDHSPLTVFILIHSYIFFLSGLCMVRTLRSDS